MDIGFMFSLVKLNLFLIIASFLINDFFLLAVAFSFMYFVIKFTLLQKTDNDHLSVIADHLSTEEVEDIKDIVPFNLIYDLIDALDVTNHKAQTILSIWFYIIFSGFCFCDLFPAQPTYEEACLVQLLCLFKVELSMHFEYPFDLGQAQFYNNSMLILFKTIIAYMIM
ncbi:hypothetical protein ACJX0J_012505 [Zea mays]